MWSDFIKTLDCPNKKNIKYESWHFGSVNESDDEKNELAELAKQGIKRATSSNYEEYLIENEPLPIAGEYNVITKVNGEAVCIIKTTKVELIPFNQITKAYTEVEGEAGGSYEYWYDMHKTIFERERRKVGKEFSSDMMVVCEFFEVAYK